MAYPLQQMPAHHESSRPIGQAIQPITGITSASRETNAMAAGRRAICTMRFMTPGTLVMSSNAWDRHPLG